MADNLPVLKANQDLAIDKPASSSLLGRGLVAIQQKQIAIADQDRRYRQARDIYDRIAGYTFYDFSYDFSSDYFEYQVTDLHSW